MAHKINWKETPKRTWIKVGILTALFLFLAIWLESIWMFIIPVAFFVDLYITRLVPWRWWENSTNTTLHWVMKLVEDIVVVLLAIYLLNTFLFQQFKIPTASLEKTCLVGDHLFVSKLSYGPRIPFTPLAFPLVHNTFPWGGKAYIETPHRTYRRAKGFGHVERGDIVVFNFPTGDTVCLKVQNPDYYTLVQQYGRERIRSDKSTFGDIIYRPVDMREHYVKRCIGMPGDSLQIRNNEVFINGEKLTPPEHMQLNYFVQTDGSLLGEEVLEALNIAQDDRLLLPGNQPEYQGLYQQLGLDTLTANNYGMVYHFPLTQETLNKLKKVRSVRKIVVEPTPSRKDFPTYPLTGTPNWTRDNYGPLWIPKKGATIAIDTNNLPLYERCIRNYEGHELYVHDGRIYIDGIASDTYTFAMDYYFMMGDNRHNSADSRAWGFVPEDHIVGKPLLVWLSLNKDKTLLGGKIRWNRFFTIPK